MLSVLLSVYYKEKPSYLRIALESIFNQSYLPSEVIIVKDGPLSTELNEILDDYSNKYEIIKLINIATNQGLSNALNIGLSKCSFELVARMDTDDICSLNRFEKQINFLNNNPSVDLVGSFATKIDEKGNIINIMKVPLEDKKIKYLIWTCPFIHPTVMFRKSKLLSVGGYNPNSGLRQDDYELWFRCAYGGLIFANIPESLYKYRFFSDSIKKNNIKVGWLRFKVGLKGCIKLHCTAIAYIGILVPLFRSLLPFPLNMYLYKLLDKLNPRNK